ncbi:hypothetical protein DFH09DRAFT_1335075 [Mycena vulgaris]|nr:hypothetical protein DFH09DRAFT_1335075 [Mycena vulgaris]
MRILLMKGRSPLAQFFEWILRINNDQDTSRTENDSKFQKYLAQYNQWDVYKREAELHQPFVELADYCIGKQAKIQLCRDDPPSVLGSDAERRPDVEFKFVPGGVDPVTPTSSSSTQVASPPTAPPPPKKAGKRPPPPPSSRELRPRADTPAGPPTTTRSSEKRASNSAKANPEKEEDPRTQCASYALELLTYGGLPQASGTERSDSLLVADLNRVEKG